MKFQVDVNKLRLTAHLKPLKHHFVFEMWRPLQVSPARCACVNTYQQGRPVDLFHLRLDSVHNRLSAQNNFCAHGTMTLAQCPVIQYFFPSLISGVYIQMPWCQITVTFEMYAFSPEIWCLQCSKDWTSLQTCHTWHHNLWLRQKKCPLCTPEIFRALLPARLWFKDRSHIAHRAKSWHQVHLSNTNATDLRDVDIEACCRCKIFASEYENYVSMTSVSLT